MRWGFLGMFFSLLDGGGGVVIGSGWRGGRGFRGLSWEVYVVFLEMGISSVDDYCGL